MADWIEDERGHREGSEGDV
jgi:hypothetical protein